MGVLTDSVRRAAVALAAIPVLAITSCASSGASSDGASGSTTGASGATTSSASTAPTGSGSLGTYLALGDSVPFGFRGGLAGEYQDAANFVGYPELVGGDIRLDVVNATCPGETTASFLDVTAQSNGCQNSPNSDVGYRDNFPLHVAYESADQSQLDFAVETLQRTDDVTLVTVQLGANDAFICQATTAERCQSPAEYQALGQTIQTNLGQILSALRDEGGYEGQIVLVTYYAFDYNSSAAAASTLLNGALSQVAEAHGATIADGFDAFQAAAAGAGGDALAAGLVLPNDVHPSGQGQQVLAEAGEAVIDD
jgi:lysophospholipase L1-like esterase